MYCVYQIIQNEFFDSIPLLIQKENYSIALQEEIFNLFKRQSGYTARFWAEKVLLIPSIMSTEIQRSKNKEWIISIEQAIPETIINNLDVFCSNNMIYPISFFTTQDIQNCSQITIKNQIKLKKLTNFLRSLLTIAYYYTMLPKIFVNSSHDCLLFLENCTIQLNGDCNPIPLTMIMSAVNDTKQLQGNNKNRLIADIRFEKQIIVHTLKLTNTEVTS